MKRIELTEENPARARAQRKYKLALRAHDRDQRDRARNFKKQLADPEFVKQRGLPQGLAPIAINAIAETMAIEMVRGQRPHPRDFM